VDECAIELRQAIEVELVECFGGSEACAAKSRGELLLVTPCDLILDE
jgi:hypothetical protein